MAVDVYGRITCPRDPRGLGHQRGTRFVLQERKLLAGRRRVRCCLGGFRPQTSGRKSGGPHQKLSSGNYQLGISCRSGNRFSGHVPTSFVRSISSASGASRTPVSACVQGPRDRKGLAIFRFRTRPSRSRCVAARKDCPASIEPKSVGFSLKRARTNKSGSPSKREIDNDAIFRGTAFLQPLHTY